MESYIIIGILAVIVALAVISSIKHFKGEVKGKSAMTEAYEMGRNS